MAVATLGSRRPRDILAVAMVVTGVALLAGVQPGADTLGIVFALIAAALWAGYVLLGKRVADAGAGLDSLAVGMAVAAAALAAPLLSGQLLRTHPCSRNPEPGCSVSVSACCPAVPYALDQVVLMRVGRARFAMLLALLPATAAVIGALVLHQVPAVPEVLGIAFVMAALVISAGGQDAAPGPVGG